MKPAALISVIFLTMVAVLHLVRLVFSIELTIGDWLVPVWASVLAVLGPGALAGWLWREQRTQL